MMAVAGIGLSAGMAAGGGLLGNIGHIGGPILRDMSQYMTRFPDLILGWVPVKHVTNMWVGFSHGMLRYRSVGALFLAHHKVQFEEIAIRFTCVLVGFSRFIELALLKSLFDYSNMKPATEEILPSDTGAMDITGAFSLLAYPTARARLATISQSAVPGISSSEGISATRTRKLSRISRAGVVGKNTSGRLIAKNYMKTYPFLSEDAFLANTYIETLTWSKSSLFPDTIEVDVLLRTWKNDWKEATRRSVQFTNPTANKTAMVGWAARMIWGFVTGPLLMGAGLFSAGRFLNPLNATNKANTSSASGVTSSASNPWVSG